MYHPVLQRRPFAGPRDMEHRAIRPDPPGEVEEWLNAPHSKFGCSYLSQYWPVLLGPVFFEDFGIAVHHISLCVMRCYRVG